MLCRGLSGFRNPDMWSLFMSLNKVKGRQSLSAFVGVHDPIVAVRGLTWLYVKTKSTCTAFTGCLQQICIYQFIDVTLDRTFGAVLAK